MPRYKLIIEYDGRGSCGWQRQPGRVSIQQTLETAFEAFCGETLSIQGAGRTDAGVHATGQAAHVDLARDWRADTVRDAVNAHLAEKPVAILRAERADDDFNARFSATRRHYLYRICNRRAPPTLDFGRVWHIKRALNADAMHEAAQRLLGHHDFSTFRDADCQANSPLRTLDRLDVSREGDEVHVTASAKSFLHRQVRSMVGSLEHVGSSKWTADDLAAVLGARDRARCGVVAPPDGLYLAGVDYPAK